MQGFVTQTEYQKHIRGEWRTVHDLWPHIRKYVPGWGYSKAEIDAMFEGYSGGGKALIDAGNVGGLTAGSIPFAAATGFLTEDNTALFWDAVQDFLGVGIGAPVCRTHIRGAACVDYAGIHPDTILLVENDDHVYIQLQGATNANAGIIFADDDFNPPAGMVRYDFADDRLEFTVATNEVVIFDATGAEFNLPYVYVDSTGVARFIVDSHNADAYVEYQEDTTLKWTAGFDFNDAFKFQISEGAPGTNVRFEIESGAGGLINLYQDVGIRNSQDLRFYDNGNYVGFKPPALAGDQIWTLPDADGAVGEVLTTNGGGLLSWSAAGTGDVTAAAALADHTVIRGDGGVKGVQDSGVIIDDADNVTGMVTLTLPNEGLRLLDTGGDHYLTIKPNEDLSANRILSIITGDAARTVTLSGNPTLDNWFDQAVKEASSPTFVKVTLSNGQIAFPAAQVASADPNTLDDYEEGTWTPTITFGGASVDLTYGDQSGYYTKIGNRVYIQAYIRLTNKGTSVGIAQVKSLPFTCQNIAGNQGQLAIFPSNISFADFISVGVRQGETATDMKEITNAGVATWILDTDFANNSSIYINGSYMVS